MILLLLTEGKNRSLVFSQKKKKRRRVELFFLLLVTAISVLLSDGEPVFSQNEKNSTFNAGLKILRLDYTCDEKKEIITLAIWYPTYEKQERFVYHQGKNYENYESKLAFNAPVSEEHRPFPLILFAHGAYGDGFSCAFFMEYLARHGYIAVAPDFKDTKGPGYTEEIAFSRIAGGNTASAAAILRTAKQFVSDMEANRDLLLWYLGKYRLQPSSFVIDRILEMNRDKNSFLYQVIDEKQIGMCGHSLGALTAMGKIGAHPEPGFKDGRIKAGLLFSGPVYPFENTVGNIGVPVMMMRGDKDPANLGGNLGLERKIAYQRAKPPKYYLVLKDATHFSFTSRVCGDTPLYQAAETSFQAKAICRYGLAFLERYVRENIYAEKVCREIFPGLVYYEREELPGVIFRWGIEPASREGISEAIKEEVKKKIREKNKRKNNRDTLPEKNPVRI